MPPRSPPSHRENPHVIKVNDRDQVEWREGLTVADLLEQLNRAHPMVIVKVNGELVRKESYDTTLVPDGAEVWAILLIGGG